MSSARRSGAPTRRRGAISISRWRFSSPRPRGWSRSAAFPGPGKSALAAALAPELGRAPGAVWLRSDVERKHLFGVEETDALPDSAYGAATTRARPTRGSGARRASPCARAKRGHHRRGPGATPSSAPRAARVAADAGVALRRPVARGAARDARASGGTDASATPRTPTRAVAAAQRAEPLARAGWQRRSTPPAIWRRPPAAARDASWIANSGFLAAPRPSAIARQNRRREAIDRRRWSA